MKLKKRLNKDKINDRFIKKIINSKARFVVAGLLAFNTAIDTTVKIAAAVSVVIIICGFTTGLMGPLGLITVIAALGIATLGLSLYKIKSSLSQMSAVKKDQQKLFAQKAHINTLKNQLHEFEMVEVQAKLAEKKLDSTVKTTLKNTFKVKLKSKASWLKANFVNPVMKIVNIVQYQIKKPIYLLFGAIGHIEKISFTKFGLMAVFLAATGLSCAIGIPMLITIGVLFVGLRVANEVCKYIVDSYSKTMQRRIKNADTEIKLLTKDIKIAEQNSGSLARSNGKSVTKVRAGIKSRIEPSKTGQAKLLNTTLYTVGGHKIHSDKSNPNVITSVNRQFANRVGF